MKFAGVASSFEHPVRPIGADKRHPLSRLLGSPAARRGLAVLAVVVLCVLLAVQPSDAAAIWCRACG